MRNLLAFITKYNAFFLFLIFEVSALLIYIKYNSFQKATFLNSQNQVTGTMFAQVSEFKSYLRLKDVNDSLASENAKLRGMLKTSFYVDTAEKHKVTDTVYKQQYTYVVARVINNSTNQSNNYITINRGSRDGIAKDMGVICGDGVVGMITAVSDHYSVIKSLLHSKSQFSAMLAKDRSVGSFIWGTDLNPRKGLLSLQNDAKPTIGETVITSGYSLFPTGIPFGKITNLHAKEGGLLLNVEIGLSVDFAKLQYVYVVVNKYAPEQAGLEAVEVK
jgi:rod shape-determining protein MreC